MSYHNFSNPEEYQKALDKLIIERKTMVAVLMHHHETNEPVSDCSKYVDERWEYLRTSGSGIYADYRAQYDKARDRAWKKFHAIQGTITKISVTVEHSIRAYNKPVPVYVFVTSETNKTYKIRLARLKDSMLAIELAKELGNSIGIKYEHVVIFAD